MRVWTVAGKVVMSLMLVTILTRLRAGTASGATSAGSLSSGKRCDDPTGHADFQRIAPAEASVDAGALQELLDWATSRSSWSVRVYRHGCLLGTSRLDAITQDLPRQWMSASKTVNAMIVGRAVQLGLISLDDPVSRYFPEADADHGRILLRHLITQSGGLRVAVAGDTWNNSFTDGVRIALHQEVLHEPGTYFEYQQHGLTLLLAAVQRAVGGDVQDFMQRELFGKLGIERDEWFWARDRAGWTTGWWGLYMSPRLMARFGQLMLNEGTWNGEGLLSSQFVRDARSSGPVNGGYGYLLWTNEGDSYWTAPVPSRRLVERPLIPSAPRDLYEFNGLGGQLVYMIPSLDMLIVRSGDNPWRDTDIQTVSGAALSGDFDWDLFRMLDLAVTDADWGDPGPYQPLEPAPLDAEAIVNPDQVLAGAGVGPRAGGCNLAGCDGEVDLSGYEMQRDEAARYFQGLVRRGAVRP